MSRYQNLMTEILDSIFEGYTVDEKGKLRVVNEGAAKIASEKLHTLVLEKSRDLWDQLEAAEDSLSGVAEEISFEELNTDPSSMANTVTHKPSDNRDAPESEQQMESAKNISDLLGSDEFDLSDVFENMDHLDSVYNKKGDGRNPYNEMGGDMSYEDEGTDVEDGDEDYDDLMIGMDDNGMGSPDASDGMDDADYENNMDMDMDGDSDSEMDYENDMNDDDMGFDFDLDLEGDDDLDSVEHEEDEMEGMGHGDKSYRMETENEYDDDYKSKGYKSKGYESKGEYDDEDKKSKDYKSNDYKSKDDEDKKSKDYDKEYDDDDEPAYSKDED